ncbi:hypothetical protein [Mycobacterium novum]|nr:hypothetical protein [Mycobacterium novum]
MTVMPWAARNATSLALAREAVFPAAAAAVITISADVRMPLALPGHRGLVWLTLLVAVALTTRRPPTVLAVGAASTAATLLLQSGPGPWASIRYLGAAVLLYLLIASPAVRARRWLVALAAAPVHLVALVVPLTRWLIVGHSFGMVAIGEKALFHLGFGLAAGMLGWAIVAVIDRAAPAGSPSG